MTVRATGPGVTPAAQVVRVVSATGRAGSARCGTRGVDAPTYRGPDPDRLVRGLQQEAGAVADLGASNLRVLWSGALWKQRRLALVLVTRRDGVSAAGPRRPAGRLRVPVRGAGAAPGRTGPAAVAAQPVSPEEPTLLLCPTGKGTLVYSRPGQPDRTLPVPTPVSPALIVPGSNPAATAAHG